jgi:hypothetical protein
VALTSVVSSARARNPPPASIDTRPNVPTFMHLLSRDNHTNDEAQVIDLNNGTSPAAQSASVEATRIDVTAVTTERPSMVDAAADLLELGQHLHGHYRISEADCGRE